MQIKKTEQESLLIPKRIEESGIIGDTIVEITKDNPEYEKYLNEYEKEREMNRKINFESRMMR